MNISYSDGRDAIDDVKAFVESIGLEALIPGRYSYLLVLHLFVGVNAGNVNPFKVIDQIKYLEGLQNSSGLKSATQFKHPPLAGLWHQHFLMNGVSSMARNLSKGLRKFGMPWFENEVAELAKNGEERCLTELDIKRMTHDAVHENWLRLQESESLTGEWILFAKHEDLNYYLCLGTHKSGDDFLRSEIDLIAQTQYPFLKNILVS